ncbi:MAG: dockerin type I repeat-containing protein, partial [Candidatus Omnitrophota bacterium]
MRIRKLLKSRISLFSVLVTVLFFAAEADVIAAGNIRKIGSLNWAKNGDAYSLMLNQRTSGAVKVYNTHQFDFPTPQLTIDDDSTILEMGDVTLNGWISGMDLLGMSNHLSGAVPFSPFRELVADLDGNGDATTWDFTLLKQLSVNLPLPGSVPHLYFPFSEVSIDGLENWI